MKRLVLLALLITIPGCLSARKRGAPKRFKSKAKEIAAQSRAKELSDRVVRLQEAKMGDIPIPLSATPLPDYFDPFASATILGYNDPLLSPEQLQQFFMQSLEQSGWFLKEFFSSSKEILLRFKKPRRICVISIRQNAKSGAHIVIFTGLSEDIVPV